MKRRKKYNQTSKYNPAQQARNIDKLNLRLDNHRKDLNAITKSHDNYISHLANFARHDIKNAIQNMDSILFNTKPNEFDESAVTSLNTCLNVIRDTIDNFAKLVPYSSSGKFKLSALLIAVELLARADMQNLNIEVTYNYDRTSEIEIELPFQMILQMINNLIINSIKALEGVENRKMTISATLTESELAIQIMDNGIHIPPENEEQVFNYGFSTTGGSGIGLYHAKFLCKQFNGSIILTKPEVAIFNKSFCITLPLTIQNGENGNNN